MHGQESSPDHPVRSKSFFLNVMLWLFVRNVPCSDPDRILISLTEVHSFPQLFRAKAGVSHTCVHALFCGRVRFQTRHRGFLQVLYPMSTAKYYRKPLDLYSMQLVLISAGLSAIFRDVLLSQSKAQTDTLKKATTSLPSPYPPPTYNIFPVYSKPYNLSS